MEEAEVEAARVLEERRRLSFFSRRVRTLKLNSAARPLALKSQGV
jgi:hypothetical protein